MSNANPTVLPLPPNAPRVKPNAFTRWLGLTILRLGGSPSQNRRTFAECFWPADGPQWAQVGPVGTGVLVAEHNGWRAEEAIRPLSRGARVACFFRNVHAVMRFAYAVDGRVVVEFDPLLEPAPRTVASTDLPFGLFGAERSALTLMERLTGLTVEPDWLATPQPAVILPPLRSPLSI